MKSENTKAAIRNRLREAEELLAAYRAKRAVDGGGHLFKTDGTHTRNRHWDAAKHYDADILIETLESRKELN